MGLSAQFNSGNESPGVVSATVLLCSQLSLESDQEKGGMYAEWGDAGIRFGVLM